MKQDWLEPIQNEINAIFDGSPDMEDVAELSDLINILKYIEGGECQCQGELLSRIKREMKDAEQWLVDFHTSGDRNAIQGSHDLASHAKYHIGIANTNGLDTKHYQSWLDDMNRRISSL